ncbi:MAG: hypothetical protein Q9159_004494 [Coniocarpon cinnabarinum]
MHSNPVLALLAVAGSVVNALPQGVTSAIPPLAPAPSGCTEDFPSSFGIAVVTLSRSSGRAGPSVASVATQSPDGQVGPGKSTATPAPTPTPVAQISDGQIQHQTKATAVAQISDGQIQHQTTAVPVAQISDGQVQHQTSVQPVAQISDGQIQHQTTVAPITQISDGQIQATYSTVTVKKTITSAQAASQISDGQPQIPTGNAQHTSTSTSVYSTLVSSTKVAARSAAAPAPSVSLSAVACKSQYALSLTLNKGVLLDNQGRTGYVASNYQFQFDKPAQAGALYTSGFSVCPQNSTTQNTLLALGGSTTFYQCLSGDFYNIYDRDFGAGQCSPVALQAVQLQDC